MAAHADGVSRAHDGVSIALLRRLRAGEEIPYVHRVDVCSAAPADLVSNLTPAPGTDQNSIWYFYCPKRYKNTRGDASGHRKRGIGDGGETRYRWLPEIAAKNVPGTEGGTFCTCSYGRMNDGSLERLGWCMTEYDLVDTQAAATAAASNYVLCKVHRPSSRAKGKASSSSSSKTAATSSCPKRKRKAAGGGNPEARPAKLIHIQHEQVQTQHDNTFTNDYPMMPCYEQPQQAWAAEDYGEFVQTEYGPMPSQLAHIDVGEWIGCQETFGAEAEQGLLQPRADEPEQGREFIQIPCGPVMPAVAEATAEDVLGAETTMPGECVSVQQASTIPDDDFFAALAQQDARSGGSSGQAPSWSMASSSSAGCSIQEPPFWFPCLVCS